MTGEDAGSQIIGPDVVVDGKRAARLGSAGAEKTADGEARQVGIRAGANQRATIDRAAIRTGDITAIGSAVEIGDCYIPDEIAEIIDIGKAAGCEITGTPIVDGRH